MSSNPWKEAKIASFISKMPGTHLGINFLNEIIDEAKLIENFRKTLNSDRRLVAIGADDERQNLHEVLSEPGSMLHDVLMYGFQRAAMLVVLSGKAKNVLMTNPTTHGPICSTYKDSFGIEKFAMLNNADLMIYEKAIRGKTEGSISEYDVYDVEDLGEGLEEKFDMIPISGVEAASNLELLDKLVDSLAPGGKLMINGTGKGKNYFNDSFFSNQFYHMHKFLHQKNGSTLHVMDVSGITVFIKD